MTDSSCLGTALFVVTLEGLPQFSHVTAAQVTPKPRVVVTADPELDDSNSIFVALDQSAIGTQADPRPRVLVSTDTDRWRVDFLCDFATRMLCCRIPNKKVKP